LRGRCADRARSFIRAALSRTAWAARRSSFKSQCCHSAALLGLQTMLLLLRSRALRTYGAFRCGRTVRQLNCAASEHRTVPKLLGDFSSRDSPPPHRSSARSSKGAMGRLLHEKSSCSSCLRNPRSGTPRLYVDMVGFSEG
jgi:hypothetical protein